MCCADLLSESDDGTTSSLGVHREATLGIVEGDGSSGEGYVNDFGSEE